MHAGEFVSDAVVNAGDVLGAVDGVVACTVEVQGTDELHHAAGSRGALVECLDDRHVVDDEDDLPPLPTGSPDGGGCYDGKQLLPRRRVTVHRGDPSGELLSWGLSAMKPLGATDGGVPLDPSIGVCGCGAETRSSQCWAHKSLTPFHWANELLPPAKVVACPISENNGALCVWARGVLVCNENRAGAARRCGRGGLRTWPTVEFL